MSTTEPSRARRVGRGTGLVLAGAVGATAITGIAFAQTSQGDDTSDAATSAADTNDSPDAGAGGPGAHHGTLGHGWGVPGTGPVLHGQDTVRTQDGTFVNILIQNGKLTAASASSITVRSDDGFTATYSITPDTKVRIDRDVSDASKLAVGRPVRVIANEDKSATLVGSTTEAGQSAMAQRRQDLRDKLQQWRQNGNGTAPSPTSSPSASGSTA